MTMYNLNWLSGDLKNDLRECEEQSISDYETIRNMQVKYSISDEEVLELRNFFNDVTPTSKTEENWESTSGSESVSISAGVK